MTMTVINGFTAEIEPNADREGVNCYVYKGRYSASLECADDNGFLTDNDDRELTVPPGTLAAILTWARGHGY